MVRGRTAAIGATEVSLYAIYEVAVFTVGAYLTAVPSVCCNISSPREASEMFQCIKYEDKREVFGLKIHSFSTLDRIKKYDGSDNEENAEKPYSIEVGEIERTINLYAIATTKFQVAV